MRRLGWSALMTIAREAGLPPGFRSRTFCYFCQMRLPFADASYAAEWARRFAQGTEFGHADTGNQIALVEILAMQAGLSADVSIRPSVALADLTRYEPTEEDLAREAREDRHALDAEFRAHESEV